MATARRIGVVAMALAAIIAMSAAFGAPSGPGDVAQPEVSATTSTIVVVVPPPTTTTTTPPTTTSAPTPLVRRGFSETPGPDVGAPAPAMDAAFEGTGVVTVAAGGADLALEPDGAAFVRAREGLVFPATAVSGSWIQVLTTCDDEAWVHASEVATVAQAPPLEPGAGVDFADVVVVVDPGHGGPNIGTSSPDGSLLEKAVNADIARRVRDLLRVSNTVDWETGTLYVGDEVPAVARVILTRVGSGESADYEAGLVYRAALANAAGAHVLVSIHNNAGWEVSLDHPGSDVYYQSQIPSSRRFGELLVEEFHRSFAAFEADWVGGIEWGAKSRLSPRDGESQYYGILRRASMPAVIAEGAYLANQSEAELLATAEFRQAYAEAVYRALVRFLTTDEIAGVPSYDPVVWEGFAGSGDPVDTCTVPAQGE